MTRQTTQRVESSMLTPEQVEDYLRTNPEFFEEHEVLLEHLRLPHHVGSAVSLVERQVQVLRNKNKQLELKLLALMKAAKGNEVLSSRMHNLSLALMSTDTLDDVLAVAQEQLIDTFKADSVSIKLLGTAGEKSPHHAGAPEALELFQEAFEAHRPICGRLNKQQMKYLFGDDTSSIESAVLVPMSTTDPLGYLALGSHEKSRFHPGMGTLFLGYLGELVTQAATTHIRREPS